MLTAAITAAVAAVLALFGIKPGPYLVVVAVVVKGLIVAAGVLLGWKLTKRRRAAEAHQTPQSTPEAAAKSSDAGAG